MLIPRAQRDAAFAAAREAVDTIRLGDPLDPASTMGPLVSQAQFEKVQDLIQSGVDEGATLVAGGTGRPSELNRGYYVRPTVFGDVTPQMKIAREEIFGPVLSIMSYDTEDEAIEIANDTPFGLAGFVQSGTLTALALSPTAFAPGASISTVRLSTAACPSVATSSPATGASSAFSDLKNISR
jgi:aldehyde dehydrogenase (NAD+)